MRTPSLPPEEYCNLYKEFHLSLSRGGELTKCNAIAHFVVTAFPSSGGVGRGVGFFFGGGGGKPGHS